MDATILKVVRVALNVIAERLLIILGLAMSFGLACWAMWDPMTGRLITLGLFAILVYIPLILKGKKNDVNEENS